MYSRGRHWLQLGQRFLPSPALAVVLLAGLAPFFWVDFGFIAKAEDFILPMTIDQWSEFFSTWQDRVGFGSSPDDRLPALFFLFWPALFRFLGASIELAQRLQFVLWFSAMGLSMYVLMRQLTKSQIAQVTASLIYLFNFYQEPVWQGVNIANLSALVALPLALAVTIRFTRGGHLVSSAALLALVSVVGSGVGANPPMALVALVPVPLYAIMFSVHRLATKRRAQAGRMLVFAALSLSLLVAVNAYWLIPQLVGLLTGGPGQIFIGQTQELGLRQLLGLSEFTPPTNVWRLQGAWVWYGEYNGVPYVPYASNYLRDPVLIALSLLLPIGAIMGLVVEKDRRLIFLGLLAIVGLAISGGTNGPTGPLYRWLWDNIPLFWVLRSPWYKATALTILGLAPLAGIFVASSLGIARQFLARSSIGRSHPRLSRSIAASIPLLFVGSYLFYVGPIIRGDFFVERPHDSPLSTHRIQLPARVTKAAEWLDEQPGDYRVLALPPALRMTTDWGYTGYIPPVGELTTAQIINLAEPAEMQTALYKQIIGVGALPIARLAALSGVRYVMHQQDVINPEGGPELDRKIDNILGQQGVLEAARFGPQIFYEVPDARGLIWGTSIVVLTVSGQSALLPLTDALRGNDPAFVMLGEGSAEFESALLSDNDLVPIVFRLGDGTNEFLSLFAQDGSVTVPENANSVEFELAEDGIYEVWEMQNDASFPGFPLTYTPLLSNGHFPFIGAGAFAFEGRELRQIPSVQSLELPVPYIYRGEFDGHAGPARLDLAINRLGQSETRLLIVNAAHRQSFVADIASAAVSSNATNYVFVYDRVFPDDIIPLPDDAQVQVALKDNWDEPEVEAEGTVTRRLRAVQRHARHLELSNSSDTTASIAMVLRTKPEGLQRSLWIRVGEDFHSIYLLAGSIPSEVVVLGLEIPTGTSYISLYSPEEDFIRADGSFVSFKYEMPVVLGTIKRERSFSTPRIGAYVLSIHFPIRDGSAQKESEMLNSLEIDGIDLLPRLSFDFDRRIAFVSVSLEAGSHSLVVDQNAGLVAPVTLVPVSSTEAHPVGPQIRYEKLSNTHLRAFVSTERPFVAVLNELYDDRWRATIDGQQLPIHVKVNGFANGFHVEKTGEYVIDFVFGLQPLADAARITSAIAITILMIVVAGSGLGLALPGSRRPRDPEGR